LGKKLVDFGGGRIASKKYSPEQIIVYLREIEVLLANGSTIGQVYRKIDVKEQKFYRWQRDYGSLSLDQAKSCRVGSGKKIFV
jgi:hypothetical protein